MAGEGTGTIQLKGGCSVANGHWGAVWPHGIRSPLTQSWGSSQLPGTLWWVEGCPTTFFPPTLCPCPTEPGCQMIEVRITFTVYERSHIQHCLGLFNLHSSPG